MMMAGGTLDLATQLRRAERRRKQRAVALTLPRLAFLVVFFLVPLASLLVRAVENPEVADALPRTGQALAGWDQSSPPDAAAYAAVFADLSAIEDTAQDGVLARRLNSEVPGARSLVMGTYRAVPDLSRLTEAGAAALRDHLHGRRQLILSEIHHLRGRDLCCWCKPGTPCHADVLMEIANG